MSNLNYMASPRPLSVTEITKRIRSMLESEFPNIAVEGELSNVRPSSTGHLYFTLKDRESVISVVMFRNRYSSLNFVPFDGQQVTVFGNLSVYAKRGSYQIICERMVKSGIGDILALLEERKKRFSEEGLFDEDRKKRLPIFPQKIAVVTSPTGAAIRDIIHVLKRRGSGLHLIILPCPVQGDDAGPIIAEQIQRADKLKLGDVIIVSRGGGSLEDLLPFSDETLVRSIAEAETPIISAVGHEIDISLSDLAADMRAPTPSAAAEIVSESREVLINRITEARRKIGQSIQERMSRIKMTLEHFTSENLERNFRILMQPYLVRLDDVKDDIIYAMNDRLKNIRHRIEVGSSELKSCSPYSVLNRGYAMVRDKINGTIINAARQTKRGSILNIRFANDDLDAEVDEIHPVKKPGGKN